jgi:glycosyltransferase 2 family protein
LSFADDLFAIPGIRELVQVAYLIFLGVLFFFISLVWKIDWYDFVQDRLLRFSGNKAPRFRKRLAWLRDRISDALARFQDTSIMFFRKEPFLLFLNFSATLGHYVSRYALAYVIVLGLGVEASFWEVAAIQALLLFVVYFAPTPGGSGLAEIGAAVFMAALMPAPLLPIFALVYRFFWMYLPAVVGLVILSREAAA